MRLDAKKVKVIRRLLWMLLVVMASTFTVLSFLSASNYVDVSYAKLATQAKADVAISAHDLGPSGEVENSTTFWFNVTVNVTNPSSRTLRLQFIKYQCWIRDFIAEDLRGASGVRYYFMTLSKNESFFGNTGLIAPRTVMTRHYNYTLGSASDPIYFFEAKKILNYALSVSPRHLTWDEAGWSHFFVYQLVVDGIPTEYYGPNSGYLIELPVIRLEQGVNLNVRGR